MYSNAIALAIGFVIFVLSWLYIKITTPPKPKPKLLEYQVTSPRVRLKDGRYIAYREVGVPKDQARFKVVAIHGYNNSKEGYFSLSQEFMEKLGLYIVIFDRAGYGESDPNPRRNIKSDSLDVEEVADKLELGSTFYIIGVSLANYISWGCLNYIPHRLAGVAMVVPMQHHWCPSIPPKIAKQAWKKKKVGDQITAWLAYHAPQLLYWWLTQSLFPPPVDSRSSDVFSGKDGEILKRWSLSPPNQKTTQQGAYESTHRDLLIGLGRWEFDPMEVPNPFPENEGSVHLWAGLEDRVAYPELQRFVASKLPWITYHEVPDYGHLMLHDETICEQIFKSLVLG